MDGDIINVDVTVSCKLFIVRELRTNIDLLKISP